MVRMTALWYTNRQETLTQDARSAKTAEGIRRFPAGFAARRLFCQDAAEKTGFYEG